MEKEDTAEEQVAWMVHLFRVESQGVQFEVGFRIFLGRRELTGGQLLQVPRRHFEAGGERMRYRTSPELITSPVSSSPPKSPPNVVPVSKTFRTPCMSESKPFCVRRLNLGAQLAASR